MTVLTPEEAAEILKVSPKTVVQLCREGRIPGAKKIGRRWRMLSTYVAQVKAEEDIEQNRALASATARGLRCNRKGLPLCSGVYFVQALDVGLIKIGLAKNIRKRLSGLDSQSAVALTFLGYVPGGRAVELELHARFGSHRVRGEWFHPVEELLALIAEASR